jgi:hypothetical protein
VVYERHAGLRGITPPSKKRKILDSSCRDLAIEAALTAPATPPLTPRSQAAQRHAHACFPWLPFSYT